MILSGRRGGGGGVRFRGRLGGLFERGRLVEIGGSGYQMTLADIGISS